MSTETIPRGPMLVYRWDEIACGASLTSCPWCRESVLVPASGPLAGRPIDSVWGNRAVEHEPHRCRRTCSGCGRTQSRAVVKHAIAWAAFDLCEGCAEKVRWARRKGAAHA